MPVEFGDLEGEVLEVDALVKVGEVALEFEQQAGQCVGLAFYLAEGVVVDVENPVEV